MESMDKIDLDKCRAKGIRVTNTSDVLTDEVADLATTLNLALLPRASFIRSGNWKHGDYKLTESGAMAFAISEQSECPNEFNKQQGNGIESIGVLMPHPTFPYLEQQLDNRFKLLRLWKHNPQNEKTHFPTTDYIRAAVVNSVNGADAKLIETFPNLEIVSCCGVGVDKIDLNKCVEKGIRVTNTPDVVTDEAADVAIALILAVLRRLCQCDRYVRSGKWKQQGDYNLTTKFSGKTVGIIGLGRIGMAVAKRAEAFNCKICYHSRTTKADSNYKYYPSVVELASNCQILVVACSLTNETHHIINREVINALGPKGVLINIGRGKHVDEPELVSALLERRLGGAGLDVFENEPNVPEQLFGLENVVLLPHIGSATVETRTAMANLVIGNLEAHFLGRPPLTPVV